MQTQKLNSQFFIPEDNEYYRKIYEPQRKGICGIAILGVLLNKNCTQILEEWGDYDGSVRDKDMRNFLENYGFIVKKRNGNKSRNIIFNKEKKQICSIQWVGKDGGKYHGHRCWTDASKNRHFILVIKDYFFCNANGWQPIQYLSKYLQFRNGYITSYLEIT